MKLKKILEFSITQYCTFIIISILYLYGVCHFFGISFQELKQLEPNALGDFLAGTFAPLGFMLLILGYLQNTKALKIQGDELKQNTEALKLQADELRNSVEEQKYLLEISRQEFEIKHFEAKPNINFKISPFSIENTDIPEYCDDSGFVLGVDQQDVIDMEIFISNYGEVARNVIIYSKLIQGLDYEYRQEIYELLKNDRQKLIYRFIGEEIDYISKNHKFEMIFDVKYFNKYGREYNKKFNVYISPKRDCSGGFSVYVQ